MQRHFLAGAIIATLIGAACAAAVAQPPAADYETHISGYNLPHAHDVAVDGAGNAFVIAAAYADGVHLDVIVIKLDPSGNEVWSRYIQGSDHDFAQGLALDSAGDVWVTGWTLSPDFPTVSAMDDTLTGFEDVFLMKLNSSDGTVLYSTFIGGDYADMASGIVINDDDEIYLTGVAGSTDFPTTPDAYQPGPSFPMYFYQDAFIMKLSPSGDSILYSTYFGGTTDDWGDRIALDGDDNIIVAGRTHATDFPLANAYDTTPRGLFVSKLSAAGDSLLFSTYFGGTSLAIPADMKADAAGNVYLTGSTRAVDFPTTPGAYEEIFVGAIDGCEVAFGGTFNCEDFFVSKLSTSGEGLLWSTFIGGTTVDQPRGIALDGAGNVYVAGYTNSSDFPLGDIPTLGAGIVVCKLESDGSNLDYTLSIDSGSANRGNGIAVDGTGAVYFSGTVGVPADIYVSKLDGVEQTATGAGDAPSRLALGRNYPNPFNPTTSISYTIPGGAVSSVDLSVFDVSGRLVKRLVDGPQSPGTHTTVWRGRNEHGIEVSAGVYFYRLRWGGESIARRMVLVK